MWPRDGCSATSSSSYYSKPQNQKKKCKKKIYKRMMMRKMRKMRRRIFCRFFIYGIRKGCGFFDVIFGFWFFALYVLVIDDFFRGICGINATLILLTTTALRSHRSTSGWRGRRFHEGRRQRKSLFRFVFPDRYCSNWL